MDAPTIAGWIRSAEAECRVRGASWVSPVLVLSELELEFPVEREALSAIFANLIRNAQAVVATDDERSLIVRIGDERDAMGRRVLLLLVGDSSRKELTMEMIDQVNAEHARTFAACTKTETLELHRRNVALASGIVRGLSDVELDRTAAVLFGAPAMSAQQAIERLLINHINEHLGSIKATLGAR